MTHAGRAILGVRSRHTHCRRFCPRRKAIAERAARRLPAVGHHAVTMVDTGQRRQQMLTTYVSTAG